MGCITFDLRGMLGQSVDDDWPDFRKMKTLLLIVAQGPASSGSS